MVGDNTMRASRINSILNRYTANIAKQRTFKTEEERAGRLFANDRVSSAAKVMRNAMKRQYTRNQYMYGITG